MSQPGGQPRVGEVGRAVERTRLAWRRTTLAATAVVTVGVFRLVLSRPSGSAAAGIGVVALAWVGVLLVGWRRIGQLDRSLPSPTADPMRRLPLVLGLLVALAAIGALIVLR